jgi:hypothetical protein
LKCFTKDACWDTQLGLLYFERTESQRRRLNHNNLPASRYTARVDSPVAKTPGIGSVSDGLRGKAREMASEKARKKSKHNEVCSK